MLAKMNDVPVILHFAAAGVNKAHQGVPAAERALIGERRFHSLGCLHRADRERSAGQQLRQSRGGRPFKHKGDEVICRVIQNIGDVFALRGGHRKSACDLLGNPHDVVILPVQLRRHANGQGLRPGGQHGEFQRPFPGQLVAQRCGQHPGKAALKDASAVYVQTSHVSLLAQVIPRLRT